MIVTRNSIVNLICIFVTALVATSILWLLPDRLISVHSFDWIYANKSVRAAKGTAVALISIINIGLYCLFRLVKYITLQVLANWNGNV